MAHAAAWHQRELSRFEDTAAQRLEKVEAKLQATVEKQELATKNAKKIEAKEKAEQMDTGVLIQESAARLERALQRQREQSHQHARAKHGGEKVSHKAMRAREEAEENLQESRNKLNAALEFQREQSHHRRKAQEERHAFLQSLQREQERQRVEYQLWAAAEQAEAAAHFTRREEHEEALEASEEIFLFRLSEQEEQAGLRLELDLTRAENDAEERISRLTREAEVEMGEAVERERREAAERHDWEFKEKVQAERAEWERLESARLGELEEALQRAQRDADIVREEIVEVKDRSALDQARVHANAAEERKVASEIHKKKLQDALTREKRVAEMLGARAKRFSSVGVGVGEAAGIKVVGENETCVANQIKAHIEEKERAQIEMQTHMEAAEAAHFKVDALRLEMREMHEEMAQMQARAATLGEKKDDDGNPLPVWHSTSMPQAIVPKDRRSSIEEVLVSGLEELAETVEDGNTWLMHNTVERIMRHWHYREIAAAFETWLQQCVEVKQIRDARVRGQSTPRSVGSPGTFRGQRGTRTNRSNIQVQKQNRDHPDDQAVTRARVFLEIDAVEELSSLQAPPAAAPPFSTSSTATVAPQTKKEGVRSHFKTGNKLSVEVVPPPHEVHKVWQTLYKQLSEFDIDDDDDEEEEEEEEEAGVVGDGDGDEDSGHEDARMIADILGSSPPRQAETLPSKHATNLGRAGEGGVHAMTVAAERRAKQTVDKAAAQIAKLQAKLDRLSLSGEKTQRRGSFEKKSEKLAEEEEGPT